MSRRDPSLPELLIMMPWWFSAISAVIVYIGLRWVLPAFLPGEGLLAGFAGLSRAFAPLLSCVLLFLAALAAFFGTFRQRLVDGQTGPETISKLGWQQF